MILLATNLLKAIKYLKPSLDDKIYKTNVKN